MENFCWTVWNKHTFSLLSNQAIVQGTKGWTIRRGSAAFPSPFLPQAEMKDLMSLQARIKKQRLSRSRAAPLETSLQLSHVGRERLRPFHSLG